MKANGLMVSKTDEESTSKPALEQHTMANGDKVKRTDSEFLDFQIKNSTKEPLLNRSNTDMELKSLLTEISTKASIPMVDSMVRANTSGPTIHHMRETSLMDLDMDRAPGNHQLTVTMVMSTLGNTSMIKSVDMEGMSGPMVVAMKATLKTTSSKIILI